LLTQNLNYTFARLNKEKKLPIGAVIGWLGEKKNFQSLQKIQLSVKNNNALNFLFRTFSIKNTPSPSPLRITLEELIKSKISLQVIKRRGPTTHKPFLINLCKENHLSNSGCFLYKYHNSQNKLVIDFLKPASHQ
jgi:hypothetical protein